MQRLKGIGVSPGVVSGRAVVLMQRAQVLRYRVAPERIADELARLDQSRLRSRQQLQDIRARIGRRRGPELAALFDAQLLMLDDPMLVPRAEALVRDTRSDKVARRCAVAATVAIAGDRRRCINSPIVWVPGMTFSRNSAMRCTTRLL